MGPIDTDVVFVAEHWHGQIDRLCRFGIGAFPDFGFGIFDQPARIAIFLPELGALPILGIAAPLDGKLLLLGIALLGRGHDGNVDNLSARGQKAAILERGIEARELPIDCLAFTSRSRNGRPWWHRRVPSSPTRRKRRNERRSLI